MKEVKKEEWEWDAMSKEEILAIQNEKKNNEFSLTKLSKYAFLFFFSSMNPILATKKLDANFV